MRKRRTEDPIIKPDGKSRRAARGIGYSLRLCAIVLVLAFLLSACGSLPASLRRAAGRIFSAREQEEETVLPSEEEDGPVPGPSEPEETPGAAETTRTDPPAPPETPEPMPETPEPTPFAPPESPEPTPAAPPEKRYCVAIDPGHQAQANLSTEPVGPGAAEQKYKVSGGTYGKTSGLPEYELTLRVSLLLRDELERRGYAVVMTRESNDVDISNVERAQIAADAQADAFVRIHANGSEDTSVHGALTICMTPYNPYNAALYPLSRALSDCIIEAVTEATGAQDRGVWETDTMSGVNWSAVPVTILEMGFMTNPDEDLRMASADYQALLVRGIADGLDSFFGRTAEAGKGPAPAQEPEQAEQTPMQLLEKEMRAELDRMDSQWDVCCELLRTGERFLCRQNVPEGASMVSASLIKLFIMGAVWDRIEAGAISEDAVRSDLDYMITISDNEAANRLTRLLGGGDAEAGMQAVTDWAASIGCSGVKQERLMLQNNGKQNYVTAEACASLLRMIWKGECVSQTASERMLALLKAQQVNDRIPTALPPGTDCAHKTGNLAGLCVADVGIIFAPAADYILCVICNHPFSDTGAAKEICTLSEMAYSALGSA